MSARHVWRFARQCMGSEVVLGGGQFVRDRTSYRALGGILIAALAARLTGGRVVARGLGVSRMHSTGRKLLFWAILFLAQPVRLRDAESLANLKRWGFGLRTRVTMDMAFLASPLMMRLFPPRDVHPAAEPHIVIAPCEDTGEHRAIVGPALDALLRAACGELGTRRVRIACHDPRHGMDMVAARRIAERYPDLEVDIVETTSLDALAQAYREAALVLSNRLHAVIFAAYADAPTIAFSRAGGKLVPFASALGIDTVCPDHACPADEATLVVARSLKFDRADRRARRIAMSEAANLNLV
ncbi:MAG: polysaccharide pyruvyl transferase family protein [Proteobacteria bacterium]|nr:polysaccharide pyruvyl transferase family protein [Pseudomonadota bacterium]